VIKGIPRKQTGVALIVSLVILLLLTLVMITAIRVTSLEQKMAGNMYQDNIAFQSAESSLREAEAFLDSGAPVVKPLKLSAPPFGAVSEGLACINGMCAETDPLQSSKFPSVDGAVATAATGISNIYQEPQYIVELIRVDPSTDSSRLYATFRITTQAWGNDRNSLVTLQSTYRLHVLSFVH
jgi:type IV pilus assembly protein PilX